MIGVAAAPRVYGTDIKTKLSILGRQYDNLKRQYLSAE
ncbi:hypothetical protein B194_2603 [Serratia plymuthica A30]|nr:hypothetical protein B194_2603 [Serratia plymuthica A30]